METSINNILSSYPDPQKENLIPILQDVQNHEGYLSGNSIIEVGRYLKIPVSKIYGVATFYNQFRFSPLGKCHIQVCRGTACHVLGSLTVLQELENELKIKAGETTRDGLFSIEVVACIGACGLAPVVCINGEFHARVTSASLKGIIQKLRKEV